MSSNLVVVALPADDDPIWKVSSEKVPHLTLLFLGDAASNPNVERITLFVQHAVTIAERGPFYLEVEHREVLGADEADVFKFQKDWSFKWLNRFRNQLLKDNDIRGAYESTEQFPEWRPHITLGYPATPAHEDKMPEHGIHMVRFDRIAVWTGNYEGPDFRLEWPDRETGEDVAWSGMGIDTELERKAAGLYALQHFGVKGMRWGVRNSTPSVVAKPKNALTTKQQLAVGTLGGAALLNRNVRDAVDKNQKNMADFKMDKRWEKDFQKAKGFGFDDQKFTNEYNAKWKDHDFSKEDWSNPSPAYKKYEDGYFKEMNTAYAKQFAEHFGSSPSGKYEAVHVQGSDLVKLRLKDTVQHADQILVTFRITRDDSGLITGLEKVEDSMAQTADLGVAFLEHFGVKGMRWGVRKEQLKSGAKRVANAIGDANFESRLHEDNVGSLHAKIVDKATSEFRKTDLPSIKAKPEYQKAKKLKNRLTNPRDPVTKQYRKEVKETYIQRLEKTANSMTNSSGTRQYTIRERGIDLPAEGGALPKGKHMWDVSSRAIKHAVDNSEITISLEVIMDADGFVIDLKPAKPSDAMAQSAIYGEAFVEGLMHFGIKGMRWGVRKPPPAPVSPTATSRVPHGEKRKTKIEVDGGANHPAHEDAIKVAEARIKLRKSGPAALSNQELREVANRLQLEGQVAVLTSSKGKRFVSQQFKNESENLARQGVRKGVRTGAKKAGAAAGAAALLI